MSGGAKPMYSILVELGHADQVVALVRDEHPAEVESHRACGGRGGRRRARRRRIGDVHELDRLTGTEFDAGRERQRRAGACGDAQRAGDARVTLRDRARERLHARARHRGRGRARRPGRRRARRRRARWQRRAAGRINTNADNLFRRKSFDRITSRRKRAANRTGKPGRSSP